MNIKKLDNCSQNFRNLVENVDKVYIFGHKFLKFIVYMCQNMIKGL